jgi:hypothetical protein
MAVSASRRRDDALAPAARTVAPGGTKAPAAPHSTIAGSARSVTASNSPWSAPTSTTLAPASAPIRSREEKTASDQPRHPCQSNASTSRTSAMNAGTPRSEIAATQSLLGHGFAVMPVASTIEGSVRGANAGYSAAQFPGPTPSTGCARVIRSEFVYCLRRPAPLPSW